jgi:hypothetical protein
MARAPAPAAAANAPTDDDAEGAQPGAPDAVDQAGAEGDEDETVVATIALRKDGTWCLYDGDEPEEGGDEGAAPSGEGGEGGESEPDHQEFDSVGALMKAVLECVREAEEGSDGKSAQDQFAEGFGGDEGAAPAGASAGVAPKY